MRFDDLIMVIFGTEPSKLHGREFYSQSDAFPPLDIVVTNTHVRVSADLPGVEASDIYIYMQYNKLVIEGVKRPAYPPCNKRKFLRAERMYRPFKRILQLDMRININSISTEMKNGVLLIEWPI